MEKGREHSLASCAHLPRGVPLACPLIPAAVCRGAQDTLFLRKPDPTSTLRAASQALGVAAAAVSPTEENRL